ncbi:acyl-CoA dehydrogenase family protein [Teredinibacter waterburyi]|uniref:acyl-CoA dehydrogenase family protein n=1 Tax=Teredinibacter waterburyi TaxID=1500538 RepID=UPI00165F5027|nr:acyl-CoA dehydrogenase family protein [Teredinibacter waterburyi]
MQQDLEQFKDGFESWCQSSIVPYYEDWQNTGGIPKEVWLEAGKNGFLCPSVPRSLGGQGRSFHFSLAIIETLAKLGLSSITFPLHSDIVTPYIVSRASKILQDKYLPDLIQGTLITAIALTESQGGSDLQSTETTAYLDGDEWVINGSKSYISNGSTADLILVLCKTSDTTPFNLSLLLVERASVGISNGQHYKKIGYRAQDTAEIVFNNCRVPKENIVGAVGSGMLSVMRHVPMERFIIAVHCTALAKSVFQKCVQHVKAREVGGDLLSNKQTVRFALAEMRTEIDVTQSFINACLEKIINNEQYLVDASQAKYWASEMLSRVSDRCLSLFGASGYMEDSFVARAFVDARAMRIFGGSTDILKDIIGNNEVTRGLE